MTGLGGVARVVSLHRYPVKSMLGEDVAELELDLRGVVGDRTWSVRTSTGKIGSGKNTRRFASVEGLLRLRSSSVGGRPVVIFPDGGRAPAGSAQAAAGVSAVVRAPVTLAEEAEVSHFDDGPVSLVGMASVAAVAQAAIDDIDVRRFRSNIVLRTQRPFQEEEWIGHTVRLGTALLSVEMASPRCAMVDAETADLPPARGLLRAVGEANRARLGVVASVVLPGRIAVGDLVVVDDESPPSTGVERG